MTFPLDYSCRGNLSESGPLIQLRIHLVSDLLYVLLFVEFQFITHENKNSRNNFGEIINQIINRRLSTLCVI